MTVLNVAIIGQGRSGKDIHGLYYNGASNLYYKVKYVVEADERRREIAKNTYPDCEVLENYEDLVGKKVDLVVNATYSYEHYEITKFLLEHEFNVLVEKPFARNIFECDTLIKIAKEKGVLLTVFQQTMYAPFYIHAKSLAESGKLGKIREISIRYSGFARRWDWQTLQKMMGGNMYNTGPHPIGVGLGLIDFDTNAKTIYTKLATTAMSSGDSDDFSKVIIEANDGTIVDIEINNDDAFSDYNLKIIGDKGTYCATPSKYRLKYVEDGENPERPVKDTFLCDENYNPMYCVEDLKVHAEEGTYDGTAFNEGTRALYEDLYFALTENRPMRYSAEQYKYIVGVIEQAHALNPLKRKY